MLSGDATSAVETRSTPTPHAKWRPPFSFQIRTGSVLIYSADPHHSEGTGQHVLVLGGLAPWRWTPEPATPLNASEPDDRHTTVLGVLVELLDGQARTCHMRVVPPQHLHPLPGRAEHTDAGVAALRHAAITARCGRRQRRRQLRAGHRPRGYASPGRSPT